MAQCELPLPTPTAPTVTIESIRTKIVDTTFHVWPGTTLTSCLIILENGFTVTGESACASPENFDAALGEKYALENAISQIWKIEGYLLKEHLYQASNFEPI
jgi:hypothetical protein